MEIMRTLLHTKFDRMSSSHDRIFGKTQLEKRRCKMLIQSTADM